MTNLAVERVNVTEQVIEYLKTNIQRGVWKPGEKIASENELTNILSVSRASVRHAIQQLIAVGVLESYQGKGVGRKMFQEIERWAKEEWDCHYEILASGLNRTGAHKFYHALGFEEVKGFKKYL